MLLLKKVGPKLPLVHIVMLQNYSSRLLVALELWIRHQVDHRYLFNPLNVVIIYTQINANTIYPHNSNHP